MTALRMSDDDFTPIPTVERGVSVDQDGKSNVWAIEPKMEVDTKSSDEKTSSTLIAVGGFAAFAALAVAASAAATTAATTALKAVKYPPY